MSPLLVARLQVLGAALLFSTGGPLIKTSSLSPWQIACFRSAIAATVILVAMPAARRAFGRGSFGIGLAFGATMTLYVLANRTTTAASAVFLQSTAPLYVMLLAPWLLRERTRGRDRLLALALAGGIVLIFFGGSDARSVTAPNPLLGNILGACAGLSWALTVLGLRWLSRRGKGGDAEGAAVAAAGNILAAGVALPLALPVARVDGADLAIVSYLGAGQIAGAYVLLIAGLRSLPAFEASLLLLLEPVASAALGLLVNGERIGRFTVIGASLILMATVAKTWLDRDEPAAETETEQDTEPDAGTSRT